MKDIKSEFLKLEGCIIRNVIPGALNTSIIEIVLKNVNQEEVFLMIYCSWRLSEGKIILTGWNDLHDSADSNFCFQLKSLIGYRINTININELNDINMLIENKKLNVFCDLYVIGIDNLTENWDFCIPSRNICFTALNNNELKIVKYDDNADGV